MSAVDLTRYGIVPDEYSWQPGAIADSQPPALARFLIRNNDLIIGCPVSVEIEGEFFIGVAVFSTWLMTPDDILTHPYPDTVRPKDTAPHVST